jgi:hypothetical protein
MCFFWDVAIISTILFTRVKLLEELSDAKNAKTIKNAKWNLNFYCELFSLTY